MNIKVSEEEINGQCLGAGCYNAAGTLQCPTCLKLGITGSYYCSQDCFKKNWVCSRHAAADCLAC